MWNSELPHFRDIGGWCSYDCGYFISYICAISQTWLEYVMQSTGVQSDTIVSKHNTTQTDQIDIKRILKRKTKNRKVHTHCYNMQTLCEKQAIFTTE